MPDDLKTKLNRGLRGFEPSAAAFEHTVRRITRRQRTRRIGAGLLALAIVAVTASALVRSFEGEGRSAGRHPTGSPPAVSAAPTPPSPQPLAAEFVGLGGSTLRRIHGLPPGARQLALSPYGGSIAFTFPDPPGAHGPPTVSAMGVLSIDKGEWSSITWADSKWEALGADSPSWSPSGTHLAFVPTTWTGFPQDHGLDILTLGLGGRTTRRLTGSVADPSWSPDGKELVYVQTGAKDQIYVVPLLGGRPKHISAGTSPVFSPDGSQIAFVGADDRIVIINSDRTGSRRYVSGIAHPESLAWSPDGSKIAFLSGRCGAQGKGVSVLQVATGAVTTVLDCRAGGVGSGPSWLPSSRGLLVGSG